MGFVPPPIYEPGYPGGMGPNFKRWLKERQRDCMIGGMCMIVCLVLMLVCLMCAMAHALTPPAALPAYLPGDDVVIYRRETIGNCETLTGKHATVTDLAWNKYTRKPAYDVNLQGWGDFERHTENVITRRQWEVMREDWMRWNWYPSWWMPWVEKEPE